MASITITFIDSANGVVNNSYRLSDEGLARFYVSMRDMYTPEEDLEKIRLGELEPMSAKEITSRIGESFVSYIIHNVQKQEESMILAKANIKPLEVERG